MGMHYWPHPNVEGAWAYENVSARIRWLLAVGVEGGFFFGKAFELAKENDMRMIPREIQMKIRALFGVGALA